jgi:hypothetical protein
MVIAALSTPHSASPQHKAHTQCTTPGAPRVLVVSGVPPGPAPAQARQPAIARATGCLHTSPPPGGLPRSHLCAPCSCTAFDVRGPVCTVIGGRHGAGRERRDGGAGLDGLGSRELCSSAGAAAAGPCGADARGCAIEPVCMRVMRNPKTSRELTRMATGAGGLRLRGGGLLSCFGCCGGEDARMAVMLLLCFSPLPV